MRKSLNNTMLTLAVLVPLGGCSKTVVVTADELCKSWRHQTVSKSDQLTDGTAAIAEGNNKSRPEWGCEYGKDAANG